MHTNHEHPHELSHPHSHDDRNENNEAHGADTHTSVNQKDFALLRYMLEHNKQHAQELADICKRFADAGFSQPAELIGDAIHYFDHANENLEKAVCLITASASDTEGAV